MYGRFKSKQLAVQDEKKKENLNSQDSNLEMYATAQNP